MWGSQLYPFAVLNGTQLDPRFWQIGDGMGMDPPSPANRGWGWGWTPDPRQIGDGDGDGPPGPIPGKSGMGPPSPIPGKSGMGMGMGIGDSAPWYPPYVTGYLSSFTDTELQDRYHWQRVTAARRRIHPETQ